MNTHAHPLRIPDSAGSGETRATMSAVIRNSRRINRAWRMGAAGFGSTEAAGFAIQFGEKEGQ